MSHRHLFAFLGALGAAFVASAPGTAEAKPLAACGNIDFSGATNLSCALQTSGGCTANCTPVACTASISASCTGSASASCTGSCSGDCTASCKVDPGKFSCSGNCTTQCGGSCETECKGNGDVTTCMSQCQASCSNECDITCQGQPPSATCDSQCEASCNGSCNVEANLSCQESATAGCTGGCSTACSSITGALFCDFGNGVGEQYIDVDVTDVPGCVSALESSFKISIAGSGALDCTGNTCSGSASINSAGCSVSSAGASGVVPVGGVFLGLGVVVASAARRRRRAR